MSDSARMVAFVRARLDDDERVARSADPGSWTIRQLGRHDQAAIKTESGLVQLDGSRATANGVHIVRQDPARTLRRIAAQRELLGRYEAMAAGMLVMTGGVEAILSEYRRVVLPSLALEYADHSDYQPAWDQGFIE